MTFDHGLLPLAVWGSQGWGLAGLIRLGREVDLGMLVLPVNAVGIDRSMAPVAAGASFLTHITERISRTLA